MGGGKGAAEETVIKLPPEIEQAAKDNLKIANEVAAIGYTPYVGPTVAGFSPQQMNSFQNTNDAAGAFGMNNVATNPAMSNAEIGQALTGMAGPNASAGGFSGYSAAPLYNEMLQQMPQAQRAAIEAFTMDPYSGRQPQNPAVPTPEWRYSGPGNWWEDNPDPEPVVRTQYEYQPRNYNSSSGAGSEA